MKVSETYWEDDGKLVIHQQHDVSASLERSAIMRSMGMGTTGENRVLGSVPEVLAREWVREAGLKWTDREAVRDLLVRKLVSGDFGKLRVWEGRP